MERTVIESGPVVTGDVVFDLALIRRRAADLGLDERAFADRVGLGLADLERHLDPSHVSVQQLVRMAAVLDLPATDLLTVTGAARDDGQYPDRERVGEYSDAQVIGALLLQYGRCSLEDLAWILDWSHARAQAAVAAVDAEWSTQPVRLSGTADALELRARPGVLDGTTFRRLVEHRTRRTPLRPPDAEHLLFLIHNELRQPANPVMHPLDPTDLVDRGLARYTSPAGARTIASQDLMFALGLASQPAQPRLA